MNDQELALRRNIIANPTDLLSRLVLADWYDENGQSDYAYFIRLQCENPLHDDRKQERVSILRHGELWAEYATPVFTRSGDFASFDKLVNEKYGQLCRFPADYWKKDMSNERTYTFDVCNLLHWKNNTIDWSTDMNHLSDNWPRTFDDYRNDRSGVALTNGFPSHWRGKILDWFTKVGRSAVKHYPIERVEFSDLLYIDLRRTRFNQEIRKRYPTLCHARQVNGNGELSVNYIQDELSKLVIEAMR